MHRNKKVKCKIAYQNVVSTKMKKIMETKTNEITMLQYQIKRYQSAGKGIMCQSLNAKLQKLLKKQAVA